MFIFLHFLDAFSHFLWGGGERTGTFSGGQVTFKNHLYG